MYRDYRDRGVNFYYVYKTLAHPELNNITTPFTIEERLQQIAMFKEQTGSQIPWICDTMDNTFRTAFGGAPNGEFVIDPEGVIVRKRFWSNPVVLRSDLAELIGPVDNPTSADDVGVAFKSPKQNIASGVVPRLDLPAPLLAMRLEPDLDSEHPFYVKLRAEGTRDLLRRNSTGGQMYIGLYLDPLYQVHWNNQEQPPVVTISGSDGVGFSESELRGPELEEPADIDPRQFLINVKRDPDDRSPLEMTVHYTICDDANTFCHAVTQKYTVHFDADLAGGSRPGVFMPEMFAEVMKMDANGDGQLTKDEFPEGKVTLYLGHMDRNDDEIIDAAEVEAFNAMFFDGQGFITPWNDGHSKNRK